jgi:hypothetical protein
MNIFNYGTEKRKIINLKHKTNHHAQFHKFKNNKHFSAQCGEQVSGRIIVAVKTKFKFGGQC